MNKTKSLLLYVFLSLFGIFSQAYAQVPLASHDVMLQGFMWNSHTSTKWSVLKPQASEIAESFTLVWLPPSAAAEGGGTSNVGYHPYQWSNQNSSWGTRTELETLITDLKAGGAKVLADIVVNHRAGNGWCDGFTTDNFGTYGVFTLKASHITKDDEASGQSACSGKLSGHNDWNFDKPIEYWGGYQAARDLAHSLTEVRDAVKAYLKWMKNVIGYDGFRWDVVKGFNPAYIKEYTQAAGAYLSVGEYYSPNYNDLKGWVEATDKTALVFDFGFKNAIFQWGGGSDYSKLGWMDGSILRPAGLVHNSGMRQYAVTFVDNHDTSFPHPSGSGWEYKGDKAKANAIMLAAPGIPCVFWRDWVAVKADIKKMIAARKKVGLNSNSDVRVTNTSGYYESHGVGTTGELICRVGSWSGTPSGFTLECSGTGWAYYTKGGSTAPTITVSPQGGYVGVNGKVTITASTGSTIYYTTNGTNPTSSSTQYTGQITITTNNTRIKAIAIKGAESSAIADYTFLTEQPAGVDLQFKAPVAWSTVKAYVWTGEGAGATPVNGAWPGGSINKVGDYYTYTYTGTLPVNIVFSNGVDGGPQTIDLTANAATCWDGSAGGAMITPVACGGSEEPGGDYYVAGNLELCGVEWGVSAAANKMTKVGSIWEKTYTNVPVGTHMYKVTDGTWNAPSPWNQQGTASGEGTHEEIILTQTSTVTIKFDGTKVLVPVVTGIRDAEFDASVVAVSGTIFVSDQDFSVFNLTGVNVTEQNGNLPNGVYVVRLANGAAKVVGLR